MGYIHRDAKRPSKKPLGGRVLKCAPGYTIYSDGRLWSDKYSRFLIPVIVKGRERPFYKIMRDGIRTQVNVSRLVATHFHYQNPRGKVIEYVDGNPLNCDVKNLIVSKIGSPSKLSWE